MFWESPAHSASVWSNWKLVFKVPLAIWHAGDNLSRSQKEDYSIDLEPQNQALDPMLYIKCFCGL